jgi:hypothetical protein
MEQRLGRTEAEIDRLAVAMESAHTGRQAHWPAPSGTRVDRLLALVTGQSQRGQVPGHMPPSPTPYTAHTTPPARATRSHALPGMGGYTGPITGEWREVTERHSEHAANTSEHQSERQTEQLRGVPWAATPSAFGPTAPAHQPTPANSADLWQDPRRQPWSAERVERADASGETAHWMTDPLPPLAPPDAAQAAQGYASGPARGSATPLPRGATFAESFPGQLREGASWEDLRGLRHAADGQSPHLQAPSASTPPTDTTNWPDWPSFLRSLDAQNGD